MYIRTGLFSDKPTQIQINSEKPCSLSYTREEPPFVVQQAVGEESGGFSTRVASLCLLDNCPAGSFPVSSVESWKISASQSTTSACCEVRGTVCLLFRIASGQSIGDFVFSEPGIYLCALGNKFKWLFAPAGLQCTKRGVLH